MCNSLLFGLPQDQISRLQRTQNAAARLVSLTKKSAHITPVLKELHWLPVGYRLVYKLLLMVSKIQNDLAPAYLCELITPYIPPRLLRSGNKSLLCEPKSKHSWGTGHFQLSHHVCGIHFFNTLKMLLFWISSKKVSKLISCLKLLNKSFFIIYFTMFFAA